MYTIRKLIKQDYYQGFLQLLEQLTEVNSDDITYDDFCKHFDEKTSYTYVIFDQNNNKVIATATLFIEKKFIHKLGSVGHIEDVVVDNNYRGKNLGKEIVDKLIMVAKDHKCYKIILNCSDKNVRFYEKCGFNRKDVQMVQYTIKSNL